MEVVGLELGGALDNSAVTIPAATNNKPSVPN
jgi:hypothetical protein